MSERKSREIRVRAGRQIFAVATLAALVLALAGTSRAQAQSTASKSAPASTPTSAKVATVNAAPATQAATPKAAAKLAAPKGQSEGIKVHGHWVIDVKNRDGSVARHLEFENSLDPGFTIPDYNNPNYYTFVPGGAAYLAGLLNGQAVLPMSGSWEIVLEGPVGLNNLGAVPSSAPCAAQQKLPDVTIAPGGEYPSLLVGTTNVAACLIAQNNSIFCPTGATPAGGTSCNLSPAMVTLSSGGAGIQLSGNVVATQSGPINTVATLIGLPCGLPPNADGSVPTNYGNASNLYGNGYLPAYGFFGCYIPQPNASTDLVQPDLASFTSSSSFPGAPVQVNNGQTIAVTVTISFSSGN